MVLTMISKHEIISLELSVITVEEGLQLLEGDADRCECGECEERMGLPDGVDEYDICRGCPVMRKMKPELKSLLEKAGV